MTVLWFHSIVDPPDGGTKHHPAAFKILRATAPMICDRLRQINERIASIFANPQKSMAEMEQVYLRKTELNPYQ